MAGLDSVRLGPEDVDYVNDLDSAARLHLELEHQHDKLTQQGKQGSANRTREALNKLHRTWPDAPAHAARSTSDDLGGLTPELRKVHQRVRSERGHTTQTAAAERRAHRAAGNGAPRRPVTSRGNATQRRGGSTSRPAPAGRAVKRATSGVIRSSGVSDAGNIGMRVLGAGVGLSLVYLLVNERGIGPKALRGLLDGVGTAVQVLIGPYDPLAGAPAKPKPAGPQTAKQLNAIGTRNIKHGRLPLAGVPGYGKDGRGGLPAKTPQPGATLAVPGSLGTLPRPAVPTP